MALRWIVSVTARGSGIRAALLLAAIGGTWWLERRLARRRYLEPRGRHQLRNLAVASVGALTVRLAETPVVVPLARLVETRRWGLVGALGGPRWFRVIAAVALMDYTLYLWHILVHRVGWLWRFHLVHHVDLDLDSTTGVRFHFGELAMSTPWRAAQVFAIGTSPAALRLWQNLTLASIVFHHSNMRLPIWLERRLAWLVVTPRMHAIHHSVVASETDSNFSSGLSLWDRLHGTLRLNVPQSEITIGVPAYRDPAELGLIDVAVLPLTHQRPSWQWPDGEEPVRPPSGAPHTQLLP